MAALGDRPAARSDARGQRDCSPSMAASGVAAANGQQDRQLVCAIFNYACQRSTFGLARNPATAADRRPEPERPASTSTRPRRSRRSLAPPRAGLHRDPRRPAVTTRRAGRAAEDQPGRRDRSRRRLHRPAPRRARRAALARRRLHAPQDRRAARDHRQRRGDVDQSLAAPATSRSPTSPPARLDRLAQRRASRARRFRLLNASAAPSTRPRCAAASSAPATPPGYGRFVSMTSATPTARSRRPAASTSRP